MGEMSEANALANSSNSPVAEFSDEVLTNLGVFLCVVDNEVTVLRTNYYDITKETLPDHKLRLGNVLHCKNGEDAGRCGDGLECKTCCVRSAITDTFRTHQGFQDLEAPMKLYTSDDHTHYIDCYVSISADFLPKQGDRLLLTIKDVTKAKKTEQELIEAKKRAEEADLNKSIFLSNMSHEMRNPLNAIIGFSDLLIDETDATLRSEYAGIIRSNRELLLQLFKDILDISRIEANTLELKYSDVDINQVLSEIESVYRLRLTQEGKDGISLTFTPQLPSCVIRTDPKRLQQVLANFLNNAFKNTVSGSIDVGYKVTDTGIYCYVTDTGIGIPEDMQRDIFKRFIKLDPKKKGAGLGLTINKMLVEKIGGKIGVESKVGEGSTFWFTLPVKPL